MGFYDDRPWLARYPEGVPAEVEPEADSALAAWDATVRRSPDGPCLYVSDTTWTFEQVDADADAFAVGLREGGFGPGDRLALYLQNDAQFVVGMLAGWKAGGIVVPLNPMLKERELRHHLTDSGASALLCLEELHQIAAGVLTDTEIRQVFTTAPADWGADPAPAELERSERRVLEGTSDLRATVEQHRGQRLPPATPGPSDPALLPYTSGTTGPPKGAIVTHGNLVHNSQVYRDWFGLGAGDVVLGVAPLFHITGLVGHLTVAQFVGIPVVLLHRFDPVATLEAVEAREATFTIGSITVFQSWLARPDLGSRDLSSLREAASGGAPVSPAIVERFEEATGVYIRNIYGMTETASPSHCTPPGARAPVDPDTGALSVGVPVSGAVVRVVDLETGEEVPPGTVGEIVTEGPMVVPGYWEQPEATAATIRDGRMFTGDVGKMDEDGWFYIVDRAKDQINASGYKVWPREVEDVLYEHPAVREAAVIGVPDEYRGETVKAFVALEASSGTSAEELVEFCRARLAAYKYPRAVELVDEIPKTLTGKFLRRDLRERDAQRTADR